MLVAPAISKCVKRGERKESLGKETMLKVNKIRKESKNQVEEEKAKRNERREGEGESEEL